MWGLAVVMVAIALPDSINPSLILTDIYLAAGPHARRRTAMFALTVFLVTAFGGVLIVFGLADLIRSFIHRVSDEVKIPAAVGATELALTCVVNGEERRATVAVRRLLSDFLRHDLGAILLGYYDADGRETGEDATVVEDTLPQQLRHRRCPDRTERFCLAGHSCAR